MTGCTNRASREIDRQMIEDRGLPGAVLMEGAALGILRLLQERLQPWLRQPILILAGRGNNGGDGLALARMLHNRGIELRILLQSEEGLSPEAALQLNCIRNMGLAAEVYEPGMSLGCPGIVIDALLGTGFKGRLNSPLKELVEEANKLTALRVAVDIPTGMNGDDGSGELLFDADHTIALGYPKWAHLTSPRLKKIWLVRLEFDPALIGGIGEEEKLHYLTPAEAKTLFPGRTLESHKGSCGKVGILGGRREMLGAALLAGRSALRSGSGLATLWLEDLAPALGLMTELMLEEWSGFLNKELDVLAIGPGLGRDFPLNLEAALKRHAGTVLLDADALHLLKEGRICREWIRGPLILTPHPGEMKMLLGQEGERRDDVLELARRYQATALLKGFRTLISDGSRVSVNLTGNPGMATAGSGDVLTGLIASLAGQGLPAYDATVLGAWLHGLAGDLAADELGQEALLAGDLADALPRALRRLKNLEGRPRDIMRIDRHEEGAIR